MARNRPSQQADATTDFWYIQPRFKTRQDAEAACEMLQGLCENSPLMVHEKKTTKFGSTIAGKFMMEVFAIPGRSYHVEDIKAHMEECHHAASTVGSYLPQLVREGLIYKVGVSTYAKRHKPDGSAPTIRPDVDLDAASDGHIARLEHGEACGCGCGDEGPAP